MAVVIFSSVQNVAHNFVSNAETDYVDGSLVYDLVILWLLLGCLYLVLFSGYCTHIFRIFYNDTLGSGQRVGIEVWEAVMIIYGIYFSDSDGCTYSCDILYKAYAKKDDAELEITRVELLALDGQEYYDKEQWDRLHEWRTSLQPDDQIASDMVPNRSDLFIREIEVF